MCVCLIGIVAFDMEMGITCFSEDLFRPSLFNQVQKENLCVMQ